MNLRLIFLIAVLFSFTGNSCIDGTRKSFCEGEIHYDVVYGGQVTLMPPSLMPRNLVVLFKDDKIIYELISPIGNSGITNLSNPSKDIYDTYLSLFTLRFFYPSSPGEIYPGFESMKGLEIRETNRTRLICGYKCNNAEVTLPADKSKVYDIWYTREIGVQNPNASTPFEKIDGILMSFFFYIGNSEFRFEAENVYRKEIPDKTFERKEKFVRVSRRDINKFINKMVSL